ncbi:hypothetical protein EsDP_00006014 [Epichloe bromicola]|uniref:Inclusion body clearance protein IML2 n=1 Tax=Epichloe bromicola TaxID=79588 RepID=A0ABQ0CWD7_9HYPO
MSLFSGFFRSSNPSNPSADSLQAREYLAKERQHLADALKWTALIMNDDVDGAWQGLERGDSSFHSLGAAMTSFMRSILGFDKDMMAETVAKLADCETRAWNDCKRARKYHSRHDAVGGTSSMYAPGTEYELVRAETQLMGAVVGVLNESVVGAMKSLYKLRKASVVLDGIMAAEARAMEAQAQAQAQAQEKEKEKTLNLGDTDMLHEPGLRVTDPVDVFIHSGANLCFGLLLVLLSLVPPAFSRILSAVGFHGGGDRARGVRMLWRSAAHDNVNGALAGMMLLGYYNGLLGAVDILPSPHDYDYDYNDDDDAEAEAEAVGLPREKCRLLLHRLRARHPDSRMWRVEESRLHANAGDLPRAIELLSTGKQSAMRQVTALNDFELGINALALQKWHLMRDTFLRCLETSDWGPGVYHYMAGCASLELYRDAYHGARRHGNEDGAAQQQEAEVRRLKKRAEELLRKVPLVSGRQRLMARQLPLETFAQRKLRKWEEAVETLGIDLADAIGPSPALEISYMWAGQKRMGSKELESAMGHLGWARCTAGADAVRKLRTEKDNLAVWAIGVSSVLRGMGKMDEAIRVLDENVLSHDESVFKGGHRDDYVLPVANYELAVIAWARCCSPPGGSPGEVAEYRRARTDECEEYLGKVKAWESFVLDARVGMRVQSGLETLKWFRKRMGWA